MEELDPLWNENGAARRSRQYAERAAGVEPNLDGAPNAREAATLDNATALAREALAAGLDADDLEGLRTLDPASEAYAAVVDKILTAPAVNKRFTGMVSLFENKIAELVAARDGEPVADDEPAETDAAADDGDDPGLALLTLIADTDSEEAQVELLTQLVGDEDTAASLLNDLAEAESEEDQLQLLARATGEPAVASDDEPDDEAANLRQENELLKLAATHPAGVKAMQALIQGGTLEDQVSALQALMDGRPVPQVDLNNSPRPLRSGVQSALSADGMSDEVADALLGSAGKGALVSSRRGF